MLLHLFAELQFLSLSLREVEQDSRGDVSVLWLKVISTGRQLFGHVIVTCFLGLLPNTKDKYGLCNTCVPSALMLKKHHTQATHL